MYKYKGDDGAWKRALPCTYKSSAGCVVTRHKVQVSHVTPRFMESKTNRRTRT